MTAWKVEKKFRNSLNLKMLQLKINKNNETRVIETKPGFSLLDILQQNGYSIYAPCGGKGTCGKCRVKIKGEGTVLACTYQPDHDIEVILPGKEEARILTAQTDFLEDLPADNDKNNHLSPNPYGVAIDLGTTTVVLYFLNMVSGKIEKISSFLNPQNSYGADVISRISYCQQNPNGLIKLQQVISKAINRELNLFFSEKKCNPDDIVHLAFSGNTTMLHILLGVDPVPIALAPFKPGFTVMQTLAGNSTVFNINPKAEVTTLPCISAYCGADIVAGLAALKTTHKTFLFIDIGTNGEIALVDKNKIYACSTAAGPTFEGATISCGKSATSGAISAFSDLNNYHVIDNTKPDGICGSGIIDVMAYLVRNNIVGQDGLLQAPFIINEENNMIITQDDIREIQLAKSAIYSGIKILVSEAGLTLSDIDALFLAGGFGNFINVQSAISIGLLPAELNNKIFPIGNSAGIGTLQFLKSKSFEKKINKVVEKTVYIELSHIDDFNFEFALNMNF
ncbi:MAG: DUF4445 domain-containing protein [Prolixibacteraceae bacterium]|nr:DUF4445 domain-containing protein [Prolixibacteraceae bacterium]